MISYQNLHYVTLTLVTILFATLLISAAEAQVEANEGAPVITGKQLVSMCDSPVKAEQRACDVYIAAVVDYHNLIKGLGNPPSIDFCLPGDLTAVRRRNTVVQYFKNNSHHQDFIAASGVAMALYDTYPCD